MTWAVSFPYSGVYDLYAKPMVPGSGPVVSSSGSWATDAVEPSSTGPGEVYFTGLPDTQVYYNVYVQIGESPANTDSLRGSLDNSLTDDRLSRLDFITAYSGAQIAGNPNNRRSYVGETHIVTIPTADFSALTLRVVFEFERTGGRRQDIATIEDGSITATSSSISFAIPAEVAAQVRELTYSVRNAANGEVLLTGPWNVEHAPL